VAIALTAWQRQPHWRLAECRGPEHPLAGRTPSNVTVNQMYASVMTTTLLLLLIISISHKTRLFFNNTGYHIVKLLQPPNDTFHFFASYPAFFILGKK
jgi:hypothetical protein